MEMDKKKIFSETGEEFYIDTTYQSHNFKWFLNLHKLRYRDFFLFKRPYFEEVSYIPLDGATHSWDVSRWKQKTKQLLDRYKEQTGFIEWDGYVGDDDSPLKTKVMRNKKLNDLLSGDTSRLEKYLNSDDDN